MNLVVYDIPEEKERAKTRHGATQDTIMAYGNAVAAAFSACGVPEEEVDQVVLQPVAYKRIGKFVTDCTKPRRVQLMFNTPRQKHKVLAYAKELRQAGFRVL